MGVKDNTQKDFFDDNERFADLCNGVVFHGEQIIYAEDLKEIDPNIVYRVEKKQTVVIPDKVKMWKGIYFAIFTLENQTQVDYGMVFRVMKTEALSYDKQLRKRKQTNRKKKNYSNPAEYLSGIQKGEKFIPVIVLVLYLGMDKKWDGATSLYEMLDIDERLQPFVTNYKLNIFDFHEYSDFSVFKTENRILFEMLSCAKDEERMGALIHDNRDRYSELDDEATRAISAMIGIEMKIESLKNGKEMEVVDMCKAWDDHWNSGKEMGKEIGLSLFVNSMKENMLVDELYEKIKMHEEYRDVTRSQIEKYY